MKNTKRKYTTEFKEEAVRLVLQEGLSAPEAARRIEISDRHAPWGETVYIDVTGS
jgi:transposase-like protein